MEVIIDGVSDLGNNQLQIEVTENTPDLYYFCQNHSGMGGVPRLYLTLLRYPKIIVMLGQLLV